MANSPNRHTRWNFVVILLDVSAFMAGIAFVDVAAVMPVLLSNLHASGVLIGLMVALQRAGWLIPQLLATSLVLHRPRKKPFFLIPCIASRLPLVLLPVAFCSSWGAQHPQTLLWLLVGVFAIFFFGDGLSGVPWHDTVARTIPSHMRGRFFGSTQLLGGLLAVAVGVAVKRVLADDSLRFPSNYGILMAGMCAGMGVSTLFLILIKEPMSVSVLEPQSFARIVRSIPGNLRRHTQLRQLVVTQNLLGIAGMAVPFYAAYGHSHLGLAQSASGLFVAAQTVGSAGMSLIWAYLNDRHGSRLVIRAVSWLVVLAPASALIIPPMARALHLSGGLCYLYAIVFLVMGATWGGAWMGFTNYVMELARDDARPLFLGLQATLVAPTVVMPLLGGWLVSRIAAAPYEKLFLAAAVTGLAGVYCARRLADPSPPEEAGS